ncbi:MAG: two-component regulator propeller domain-containing protein [Bacteroidota bacterium]
MKKITLLCFCFLFLCFSSHAQLTQWINYMNGSIINCFTQQNNILWFGTTGGLVRFDMTNESMTFLNKANSGLPSNEISSLASNSSQLWVATNQGLARFENNAWVVYNQGNSLLPSDYINKVVMDPTKVYVGTARGLAVFSNNTWQINDSTNTNLPGNNVTDIDIDAGQNIWLCISDYGGYEGCGKFSSGNWLQLMTQNKPLLYIDLNGNKWVGTEFSGLYKYDINGNLTIFDQLITNCVKDITGDSDGNIWLALSDLWTDHGGLAKYDGSAWTYFTQTNSSLNNDILRSVFADNTNNLWFGIMRPWNGVMEEGAGLVKFDHTQFKYFFTSNSAVPVLPIDKVVIDKNQTVWMDINFSNSQQVGGGFINYDGYNWHEFFTWNSGLPIADIHDFAFDSHNALWAPAYHTNNTGHIDNYGIIKYDNNWTFYNSTNSILSSVYVQSIAIDDNDTKWVTSDDGIYTIDSANHWTKYTTANSSLPFDHVSVIKVFNGTPWIARGSGLYHFDGSTWIALSLPYQPGDIIDIEMDSNNVLWMGLQPANYGPPLGPVFKGGGILKYDGTFTKYDTSNSLLPSVRVQDLVIDNYGNIWVGTEAGLSKFDHTTFTNFNKNNSPLSGLTVSSLAINHNNDLWMSTTWSDGISVYNENGFLQVNETQPYSELSIFPNPFSDQTFIKFPEGVHPKKGSLSLFTSEGKEIVPGYKVKNDGVTLYRGNLKSGLYVVKLKTEQNLYTVKLVVM